MCVSHTNCERGISLVQFIFRWGASPREWKSSTPRKKSSSFAGAETAASPPRSSCSKEVSRRWGVWPEAWSVGALPHQESDFAFFKKYTFCGSLLCFQSAHPGCAFWREQSLDSPRVWCALRLALRGKPGRDCSTVVSVRGNGPQSSVDCDAETKCPESHGGSTTRWAERMAVNRQEDEGDVTYCRCSWRDLMYPCCSCSRVLGCFRLSLIHFSL